MAEGGGGGGLGGLPVPKINFPGDPFAKKQPYGFGIGFPGLGTGIGSKGVEIAGFSFPFSGPSPKSVTFAQGAKLAKNPDPILKKLGLQLENAAQHGIFTSTGNPQQRAILDKYVHEAVTGLEKQLGWSQAKAYQTVANLISKPGATGALVARAYRQSTSPPNVAPPMPSPVPVPPAPTPVPARIPTPGTRQLPVNPMMTFQQPAPWWASVAQTGLPLAGEAIGGVGGFLIGNEAGYPVQGELIGAEIGKQIGAEAANRLVSAYQPSNFGTETPLQATQTGQPISPTVGFQPSQQGLVPSHQGMAPLLEPCPECGYNPQPIIQRQEQEVRQEIQRERAQGEQQTLQQTQQEIDRLRQLESQPIQTRNIPREIQEKQQLLQTLEQLQQGGLPAGGQGTLAPSLPAGQQLPVSSPQLPVSSPQQPGQLAPMLDYQSPRGQLIFVPEGQQPPIGGSPPSSSPPPPMGIQQGQPPAEGLPVPNGPGSVKFCVVCTSQNESLKFLNGEPSECSVLTQ